MISVKLLKQGSLEVLGEQKNTGVSPFIYTLKHPSVLLVQPIIPLVQNERVQHHF